MRINFTQIPDRLPYPSDIRAELSTLHSDIITCAIEKYDGTFKFRRNVVELLNTVSYYVMLRSSEFKLRWKPSDLFNNIELVDSVTCRAHIDKLYLNDRDIDWDIQPVLENSEIVAIPKKLIVDSSMNGTSAAPTPKSDLYIQPPQIPQFDSKSVWASKQIGDCLYTIYTSLPKIPTKQCEISVTTDISSMTDSDLLKLYPNVFIRTRPEIFYQPVAGLSYHQDLGVILPIEGFTEQQVIDNIIKYPHLYRLSKMVDDSIVSFYSTIELDGELYKVSDVWRSLPESSSIPYVVDFVKEYVVRRYLLERDVRKVDHKYKLFGELTPFLTLFMPPEYYSRLGYSDSVKLARCCVESRVRYKQSRNPVIRRIQDV